MKTALLALLLVHCIRPALAVEDTTIPGSSHGTPSPLQPAALNCAPTDFCLVSLSAGERLRGVAVLDPSWNSSTLASGKPGSESEVPQILLWPAAWGSTSSLAITSDKGTYLVRLTADSAKPIQHLLALRQDTEASEDPVRFRANSIDESLSSAVGLDPSKLHHNYRITGRRDAPSIVFDDGVKTYIGWTKGRPAEAPIVLGHDQSGVSNLLNPHVTPEGNWYIIDAVLPKIELRLGAKTTAVIINKGLPR